MSDGEGIGAGSPGDSAPPPVLEPGNAGETGDAAAAENAYDAELPAREDTAPDPDEDDPDFVRLAPLTLDLIADRMTRLGYKFERQEERLYGGWEKFTLYARVTGEGLLHLWAEPDTSRASTAHAQIAGICDGWNATQFFLKASSSIDVIENPEKPGEKIGTCGWSLSFEAPFNAGIAPVQLSLIISRTLGNIHAFLEFARLRAW